MSDCIFCKIAAKKIPSSIVYEDDIAVAFKDLEPQAPVHILIIPKKHIKSLNDTTAADKEIVAHITVDIIPKLAEDYNIAADGFRVVINTGVQGGQTVNHLHFHLIGGRSMQWPPG
ncbi:histidine triad nucleotide-binding protein [Pectinatus sottacetonis]|uniref:histidine triad nucleotide-binding protein n=1 Tax=Pectinatus sottacetonis TaxID=1002795 RepID=UPI0018C7E6CC|nr:histidine triad nucleotide-binding protein [Pectinatus sottacetonis]